MPRQRSAPQFPLPARDRRHRAGRLLRSRDRRREQRPDRVSRGRTRSPPSASSRASTNTPTSRSNGASPTPSSWPNWHQHGGGRRDAARRDARQDRRHPRPGRDRRRTRRRRRSPAPGRPNTIRPTSTAKAMRWRSSPSSSANEGTAESSETEGPGHGVPDGNRIHSAQGLSRRRRRAAPRRRDAARHRRRRDHCR